MKRHLLLMTIVLGACATLLHAQSSPSYPKTMYVTYDGSPVYDSADHRSRVAGELRLGDSVRVLGVAGRFCRIEHGEGEGFLYWANVAPERPKGSTKKRKGSGKKTAQAPAKRGSGEKGDGPAPDSTAAVSSGMAEDRPLRRTGKKETGTRSKGAQCRAVTKAGRQCSRTATDSSGYCWQHRK